MRICRATLCGGGRRELNGILSLAASNSEDVYIANVLKCRPPETGNPRPEEVAGLLAVFA